VPGFRVHITGSTIIGAGYGTAAWALGDMPPMTCVLAGGLCSVAGMLPDLDSGPGIPLKESVAFAAAVVPMMMIHRFHQMQLPLEAMILAGAAIYLVIRFGLSWLLKNYSHHRGMFHSLRPRSPARRPSSPLRRRSRCGGISSPARWCSGSSPTSCWTRSGA
jgi:hypothetical protein